MLTGFMGTGKSTVGRRVAKTLGFAWIDTDRIIEERHGSIPEIFARAGETVFRGIERNLAAELSTRTRHVFSTGGRMLLDAENTRAFSATGRIFSLVVDPDVLVARLLQSKTPRPLLAGTDPEGTIRKLLAERQSGYARFAQVRSGLGSPDTVAASLAKTVQEPTETSDGRRGVAVLGDATSGLAAPIVVVSDATVADLHGPSLGPVDRFASSEADVGAAGSIIYLGGMSVTARVQGDATVPQVVAPTTPSAMDRSYPANVRVITDLASLQTRGIDTR